MSNIKNPNTSSQLTATVTNNTEGEYHNTNRYIPTHMNNIKNPNISGRLTTTVTNNTDDKYHNTNTLT